MLITFVGHTIAIFVYRTQLGSIVIIPTPCKMWIDASIEHVVFFNVFNVIFV